MGKGVEVFCCGITELFAMTEFLQQLRNRASTYFPGVCKQGVFPALFQAVGVIGASASAQAALRTHSGEGQCQFLLPASLQETSWEKSS